MTQSRITSAAPGSPQADKPVDELTPRHLSALIREVRRALDQVPQPERHGLRMLLDYDQGRWSGDPELVHRIFLTDGRLADPRAWGRRLRNMLPELLDEPGWATHHGDTAFNVLRLACSLTSGALYELALNGDPDTRAFLRHHLDAALTRPGDTTSPDTPD